MKTLVIVTHPELEKSRINRKWVEEIQKYPEISFHRLYDEYPNEDIDIYRERELLVKHDRLIFQFPFYWYSSPPLLKKWMDAVLVNGFAYGPGGTMLYGKEFGLAISTGSAKAKYQAGGQNQFTISELTKPYQALSHLMGTTFLPIYVLYNSYHASEEEIEQSAKEYIEHLLNPQLEANLRRNNYEYISYYCPSEHSRI